MEASLLTAGADGGAKARVLAVFALDAQIVLKLLARCALDAHGVANL